MKIDSDAIANALAALEETPRRFAAATQGLPEARLQFKPDEKTWSANENLAHMRACADVWGDSIDAMLAQEHPTLRHISPRTWMRKTDYPQLPFHPSFQAFVTQREALLSRLKGLEVVAWSRGATIKEREYTVYSQVARLAQHEHAHCEQLEALLAAL